MDSQLTDLSRQAARALNRGATAELEQLAKRMLQLDRRCADAWFFLSITATARKKHGAAIELIDNAVALVPDNTEYLAQKARLHAMTGDRDAALGAAEKALSLAPVSAVVIDTLGVVFSRFELHDRARAVLQRGVEVAPDNPQFQFNLASVEQFLGHEAEAEAAYRRAVELKPDFYRAWWALSELEKNRPEPRRLEALNALSRDGLTPEDSLYLGHALARELEKAGDYDAAFSQLRLKTC